LIEGLRARFTEFVVAHLQPPKPELWVLLVRFENHLRALVAKTAVVDF